MAAPGTIAVGDDLPALVREGTVQHWNRFAAVNHEFAAHHWDDEVAKEEGFPAPFAMAPLLHSYLHTLLRDWMGDAGRIAAVNIRLRSPFLRGRTLTAGGRVTGVRHEEGERLVDLEVWETDDQGTAVATGTATVAFPDEA
jgi:acyl dehydratase